MLEKIAFQKKLISKQDTIKAMAACKHAKNYESALKKYFIANDLIPESTLDQLIRSTDAIKIKKSTLRFGALAVKMGFISQKVLEAALAIQNKSLAGTQPPKLIGQILVEAGRLTKEQISMVIDEQKRLRNQVNDPEEPQPQAPPGNADDLEKEHSLEEKTSGQHNESADAQTKPAISDNREVQSEQIPGGMLLDIEDNGMHAYIRKTDTFDPDCIVDDIFSSLAVKGIRYGLADEDAVQGFIDSKGFNENRFMVAEGTPRKTGRNGRIEYYFDTDHLRAGGVDKEGNIDFKDRGKIPKIDANTLLAERFEPETAITGYDIFGNELPVDPAHDTVLKADTGVILSEDGRYAYSQISGHPKLSTSGSISVVDPFESKGDVGYQTGHLVYDGNIDVKGSLRSGFKIIGHDINIKEIDGGEIHALGDVIVLEGVNGAKIFSKGHISASFIHDSEISCLGNVSIEKEIVDSTIEASGQCKIKAGKIINSVVCANQGVAANHIGTDKTDASTLVVGKNTFIKNELIRIEKQTIDSEKRKLKLEKRLDTLKIENEDRHQSSGKLANELDKIHFEQQEIKTGMAGLKDDPENQKEILSLKSLLKQKDTHFARLDRQLNALFDDIEKNDTQIEKINEEWEALDDLIEDLNSERENYLDWQETNPGKSIVSVEGTIVEGTVIKGRHAQKELKETVSKVLIEESKLFDEQRDTNLFEIQIHDNIKTK